jgi:serine/threonine protein kinase
MAPENILMGRPDRDSRTIHLVDFGMASKYVDRKGKHLPYKKTKSCGSPRFKSVRSHLNMQRSRRDDLEALGHVLIYFARGGLPWLGKSKAEIVTVKNTTYTATLCEGLPGKYSNKF